MAIINGLQDSLDLSYGQIPQDLYALYDYMKDRLMDASRNMTCEPIDEVANLIITIKSAWDNIPDTEKQKAFVQQQAKV